MNRPSCACSFRVVVSAGMFVVASLIAASPTFAATYSWLAKSGSGNWTTASNWSLNSSYPGADAANLDAAQFHGDLTGNLTPNLNASVSIQQLFVGDSVVTSGTGFSTTISTTNASTLTFVSSGTAVISNVGGNTAGTRNVVVPDIFITAPTLEFRNNLSSGGAANAQSNMAVTGNVTSGTSGSHILRYTPAGNTTNSSYLEFSGNITNGPGTVSIFYRKDMANSANTLKLTGTGNTFSGGITFTGGSSSTLEASPASGTNGALGTGLFQLGTGGSSAVLNMGGSLSTVTEVCGITIAGSGARRIVVIGAGDRILSGTINQATTGG